MRDQEREVLQTNIVTGVVDGLVSCLVNTQIYWSSHQRVLDSIHEVQEGLQQLCELLNEDSIVISVASEYLVFQQRPLLGASLAASRIIKPMKKWESGGIEIHKNVPDEDLSKLVENLLLKPEPGEGVEQFNAKLLKENCSHVSLMPLFREESDLSLRSKEKSAGILDVPVQMYQSMMDMLQSITVSICTGGRINFEPVKEQAEQMLSGLESDNGPLLSLARQDQYDAFTFGHSVRVSLLVLHFARALTTNQDLLVRMGTAALLHDVGKAKIPFEILHSRNILTHEEREIICRHPECGAEILLDHDDCDPMAVTAAFGHHQTNAHKGYPKTLHEHEQSLITSVVAICDVYEALTAARPYKRPMSPIKAYRIMLSMEGHFHSGLLRKFIETNGVYPNGQLVKLTSDELARVLKQSTELLLPRVEIISDLEGNILLPEDLKTVDLDAGELACKLQIAKALEDDPVVLAALS